MNLISAWAAKGSMGLALYFGNGACTVFSLDNRFGTQVIVWSDIEGGRLPDFAIHSHGLQTRSKDNKPIILWR